MMMEAEEAHLCFWGNGEGRVMGLRCSLGCWYKPKDRTSVCVGWVNIGVTVRVKVRGTDMVGFRDRGTTTIAKVGTLYNSGASLICERAEHRVR